MKKTKVLLLQGSLMRYRVPCWNILAKEYDFTIGYYDRDETEKCDCLFKKVKFEVSYVGPLAFVKGIRKYAKSFDVVIVMDDLHVPIFTLIPILPHKYKVLTWGIGFRVSYTRPYQTQRKHTLLDHVEGFIMKKCDAIIFYMEKAKEFWRNTSLNMDKVFCAPNTTEVLPIEIDPREKINFLFVGSLYRGKGIDRLIYSFADAKKQVQSSAKLNIVGGGEMRADLESIVDKMGITSDVNFIGPVYDEKALANYFKTALLCISPSQGGLSCPKSMGYGVPFVTRKDAITGGEIYHMTPGVNGILYENDSELTGILSDAITNKERYLKMGEAAKEYYYNNATPCHMAKGAIEAIEFVINNK